MPSTASRTTGRRIILFAVALVIIFFAFLVWQRRLHQPQPNNQPLRPQTGLAPPGRSPSGLPTQQDWS